MAVRISRSVSLAFEVSPDVLRVKELRGTEEPGKGRLTAVPKLARLANMITVNMHEAKTRLSELVKAVEERNETVVLCRDGREVAEIRRRLKRRAARNLTPDPRFQVEFAPGYRPAEPLTGDEWPETLR
jgi:antitoxin (DNA-binding transcriptional repressor) of toxin-antitoxin stability system